MNKILKEDLEQIIEENNGLKELANKTFAITGASGMVGSYFLYTLIYLNEKYDYNINILALVRNPDKLPDWAKEKCNVIIYDVIEPLHYDGTIDYFVHAASPASPLIMKNHPFETNLANTVGTYNTLKCSLEKKVKGYMFISSREIYGQPNEGQEFFYENGMLGQVDPLVPRNGYAEGKKAAENMCVGARDEYGLNTKIVRLAHTYGPGMSIYDGRVQADFLKNVIQSENIIMKSTGESIRTYTYISDAISAMFKVLLNSKDFVYNIADENSRISIKELAETLVEIANSSDVNLIMDVKEDENKKGMASFTNGILCTEKIRNELNWKPKYNIRNGFYRTIEYIKIEKQKEESKIEKLIKK